MKTKKKIISLFIIMISIVMAITSFPFIVHGDDSTEETDSYSTNSGITINLPKSYYNYALWNQAPEDSPGWKNLGAPSYDTMQNTFKQNGIELSAYRDDFTGNSGYLVSIQFFQAPEELTCDTLLSTFIDRLGYIKNVDDLPVFGYGI